MRGQLDLELDKERFRKPVVVGQELAWLLSESTSQGQAIARGTIESEGGGEATQHATTKTLGTSIAEMNSTASTTTTQESWGTTEGHVDSRTDPGSARMQSGNSAQAYDAIGVPISGATLTTGWGTTNTAPGSSSANSTGNSHNTGVASGTADVHAITAGSNESTVETEGITKSTAWSRGSTLTHTDSKQQTQGRAQTFRSVFEIMPTSP
jgi:hypothetical protein